MTAAVRAFVALAPILWIAVAARAGRGPVTALSAHTAVYAALMLIGWLTSRPGHGSLGDSLAPALYLLFSVPLVVSFAALAIAMLSPRRRGGPVFLPIFGVLVGGAALAAALWAAATPSLAIAAAERVAGERPYCLIVRKRPVTARVQLAPPSMLAPNEAGHSFDVHGLLVVEDDDRRFYLWSYRRRAFDPVSDRLRQGLDFDALPSCGPRPHFAESLPWW